MRDVNDTGYYMRYGLMDWGACRLEANDPAATLSTAWADTTPDIQWSPKNSAIALRKESYLFPTAPADNPVILSNRRGAARDAYGNWYWVDEARTGLMVQSSGTGQTAPFWHSQKQPKPRRLAAAFKPLNPRSPSTLTLQGLTVTAEHFLIVGVLEPAGLLIFDLHGPDEPMHQLWDVPFVPFDMAATSDGGLVVLDRHNQHYWRLDRHFYVNVALTKPVDTIFQPKDSDSPRQSVPRATARAEFKNAAVALPVESDPIAIEILPDHSILILDSTQIDGLSGLYHFRDEVQVGERLTLMALRNAVDHSHKTSNFTFAAHDFALSIPPESSAGEEGWRLFLIGQTGNQAFALFIGLNSDGTLTLTPQPAYFPVRLYGGKGLVADEKGAIYYDFYERWLELVIQSRPRFVERGIFYTPIVDSQIPDCVWHRLMLDACLPPQTAICIESRTANNPEDLLELDFQPEPPPYQRGNGSELPFVVNPAGIETFEILFQKATGRYMQLRITFKGDGVHSPNLRELRAYYPRFSYGANYLGAVYQEDTESALFLERYLANIEGFYTTLEGQIASIQGYFDPKSVPTDTVDWLASWFGIAFDNRNRWDDSRKRFFIQHALQFFQMRATIPGLVTALRLVLDECLDPYLFADPLSGTGIRIIETFRRRQFPGVLVGDPSDGGGLMRVREDSPWEPGQGRATLHQQYRDYLNTTDLSLEFPLLAPEAGSGILSNLYSQLHTILLNCGSFATDREMKVIFVDKRLSPWQNRLPQADNPTGRVESIIDFLHNQHNDVDENALVLLLRVLHERLDPGDACHQRLVDLERAVLHDLDAPAQWAMFAQKTLGFVPEQSFNVTLWHDFLARRYGSLNALNEAHYRTENTLYTAFTDVDWFSAVPADGAPLQDWFEFESVVLAMHRTAHRFTVLLPLNADEYIDPALQDEKRLVAEGVLEIEKPAHTIFDIRFYWAMFRIGEVRLGDDIALDRGSRVPQLMAPLVLGRGFTLANTLDAAYPANLRNRFITDRDSLV